MTVTLKGLRAFNTVLRYGSFTRAAGLLHITQPALTVQIRQLEAALGLRLLDRTPQGAEPTAAGRELARSLEPLLRELDHTVSSLQDRRRGGAARCGWRRCPRWPPACCPAPWRGCAPPTPSCACGCMRR
ncbi:LysR family transcriptional regulator [Teichococcus aestuarii]|uniref:LysR family transcriptional regulator n=1 Tax=Teichococcus aestuarii TaxID=568898 RepID=UPI003605FA8A